MLCASLKHARCYILITNCTVIILGNRCQREEWGDCYTYTDMALMGHLPLSDVDYGTCESEPGYCHADSLLLSLRRGKDYTRNCGFNHPSWRIAKKAERRL